MYAYIFPVGAAADGGQEIDDNIGNLEFQIPNSKILWAFFAGEAQVEIEVYSSGIVVSILRISYQWYIARL